MEAIEGRKVTRFRGSLILKVASATLIPVAVAAGLGFFWEYREDRNAVEALILHEMREEALALAAAIGATREQADLQTIVSNFLRNIGADSREVFGGLIELGLSKIFVVDASGVVLAGGRTEIIGRPLEEALGHGPMGLPAVLTGRDAHASEFTVGNGRKVVHISVPLRIDRQDPARVTGAVHLMEPYALLEGALLPGVWRRTSVAVALAIALVASLTLILGWVVVAPVRRLADGMQRAGEELDVTLPVTSRDEIGQLTRSFNEMVADLHRKRGTLATLYAIERTVSQSLDLEVVLTQTLDKICEVMAVEAGGHYLLEPDGETMVLRVHRGLPSTFAEAVRRIRVGEGVSGQAIALRRPVAMAMADYPTPRLAPILVDLGIKHMASAPIISRGRIVGAINVGSHRERPFTEEELDLIGSIGQQVGASVENARLYEAARREISDRQRAEEEVRKLARFPSENPSPILRVSNDGVILYANEASESLLRDWKCSVGNPVPEVYRDVVRDVVVHRSRTTLDVQSGEVVYSLVVVPILDAGYVNLYGRDITERKRAEQALATHTSQLEAIRAVTAEITRELNLPTVLGLITRQAAELVGATVGEISLWDEAAKVLIPQTGHGLGECRGEIPIGLGEGIAGTVAQRRKGLIVNDYPTSPYTLPFFLARGITAAIGEPLLYGDRLLGALVVGNREVGRPFTEHDRETLALFAHQAAIAIENARLFRSVMEQGEELRTLAARLAEAEEAQRGRLTTELHDRVGQKLTALSFNLNLLRSDVPAEGQSKLAARLDDSVRLVETTLAQVRDLMEELRPPLLDDHGLLATLRWHAEWFATRTGVATVVHGEELTPRLPRATELTLFRIVQEALTNVTKHARASQVTLALEVAAADARLTITDDGAGFDPAMLRGRVGRTGWGLISMRERAAAVGGRVRVESVPGQGTRLVVEVPRELAPIREKP